MKSEADILSKKFAIPAVIIVGGQSTRMGHPKHLIDYGFGPHWVHAHNQLSEVFQHVCISCNLDQLSEFEGYSTILDLWTKIGPIGAIASILESLCDEQSVFILSCDLPHFDSKLAIALANANDPNCHATCAKKKEGQFPEPLVAIWNKSSLAPLQSAIKAENYSLQSVLKSNKYKSVIAEDDRWLTNVNYPDEARDAMIE